MNILENTIAKLVFDYPFLGYFFMSSNKVLTETIPTAGVSVTDNINLYVNPKWFATLSDTERAGVLEHEMLHIINGHLIRGKVHPKSQKMVVNMSMDGAINQYIEDLPKDAVTLGVLRSRTKMPNLMEHQNYEYYLKHLLQHADKMSQEGDEGDGDKGTHEKWGESVDGEVHSGIVKDIAGKALERAKAAGREPRNEILAAITSLGTGTVPWNKILQRYVAQAVNSLTESTRYRPNRRHEYQIQGQRLEQVVNLVIVNDTSGSTMELQNTFFREIESLFNKGYNFKVIECDTEVQRVYDFKPKKDYSVKGCGGTLYEPAFKEAVNHGADLIIFFGDGDSADSPKKPRVPTLWILPEGCKPPVEWGKTVHIK